MSLILYDRINQGWLDISGGVDSCYMHCVLAIDDFTEQRANVFEPMKTTRISLSMATKRREKGRESNPLSILRLDGLLVIHSKKITSIFCPRPLKATHHLEESILPLPKSIPA